MNEYASTLSPVESLDMQCETPLNPTRGEQAMWRAVILQALLDAARTSGQREAQQAKAEAIAWLRGNSEDFRVVCELAGYSPSYIRQQAALALGRQCRWRADPGTSARYVDFQRYRNASRQRRHECKSFWTSPVTAAKREFYPPSSHAADVFELV